MHCSYYWYTYVCINICFLGCVKMTWLVYFFAFFFTSQVHSFIHEICMICIIDSVRDVPWFLLFHVAGFSLDSGFSITKGRGLTIVSGAPRANHCGAVVLLRKENEASARLSPEYILEGPGLASSFGYDVAVVDLNGDGYVTQVHFYFSSFGLSIHYVIKPTWIL